MGMPRVEMTGLRFGRLVVLSFSHTKKVAHWHCKCDCGNSLVVARGHLLKGHQRSCGCLQSEEQSVRIRKASTIHGHSKRGAISPTYVTWQCMMHRCYYAGHESYPIYGGAGIVVCDRWHTFTNFLEDMGIRPDGLTIDRYPNPFGNYEPGNCRWATRGQQQHNRRDQYKGFIGL